MLPKTKEIRNYYFKRGWSFEMLNVLHKKRGEDGFLGWRMFG